MMIVDVMNSFTRILIGTILILVSVMALMSRANGQSTQPFMIANTATPSGCNEGVAPFFYNLSSHRLYFCGPGGVYTAFSSGTAVAPYSTTTVAITSLSISAATHGQGTIPLAFCKDGSSPRAAELCSYTTAANGDIAFVFNPAFTGQIIINGSIGPTGSTGPTGAAGTNGAISVIQDEGIALPVQPFLNFKGSPINCVDNPGATSTDCTVTGPTDAVTGASNLTTASRLVLVSASGVVTQLGSLGTTTTVLHGNAAGAPTFGAVVLTTDVTGTLPQGNGGIGATTFAGAGLAQLGVANAGHLIFTDNTYDIGASGATRPRNYYGSGSVTAGASTWSGTMLFSPDATYNIGASNATRPANVYVSGSIYTNQIFVAGAQFFSPSDGILGLYNLAGNDWGLLRFGGATTSYPAIGRSGAVLTIRLGDNSGFAGISELSSQVVVVTVSGLGTCNSGAEGTRKAVSDALAPTFLVALTGGGAVHAPAYCDGSNWVAF